MPRRPWPLLLPAALLLAAPAACSGDDDDDDAAPTTEAERASTGVPSTAGVSTAPTPPPSTAAATTTPPSLTAPASFVTDTEAVGGSTLSTVDLATGTATVLGGVGTEVGVLGIAVVAADAIAAVTDMPTFLVLDPGALDAAVTPTPIDAGGDTLLALARRPSDGALFAVGDSGRVFRLEPDGRATPVAEVGLDDPGVGLDVAADGTLEVVVATGARFAVDAATGDTTGLPALAGDEAPPRIVAVAHDAGGRFGIDAASDELVAIADDGTVATIGPLGFDATDGASLDIGADGVAVLANPG
jgi:hypothetical protein